MKLHFNLLILYGFNKMVILREENLLDNLLDNNILDNENIENWCCEIL